MRLPRDSKSDNAWPLLLQSKTIYSYVLSHFRTRDVTLGNRFCQMASYQCACFRIFWKKKEKKKKRSLENIMQPEMGKWGVPIVDKSGQIQSCYSTCELSLHPKKTINTSRNVITYFHVFCKWTWNFMKRSQWHSYIVTMDILNKITVFSTSMLFPAYCQIVRALMHSVNVLLRSFVKLCFVTRI